LGARVMHRTGAKEEPRTPPGFQGDRASERDRKTVAQVRARVEVGRDTCDWESVISDNVRAGGVKVSAWRGMKNHVEGGMSNVRKGIKITRIE